MADSEEPEKTIEDEIVVGKYAAAAEIANRKLLFLVKNQFVALKVLL